MRRFLPAIVLILLAPLVAEVLPGSTPITMPGLVLVDLLIYGPGALLVRELVLRRRGGWSSLLIMGIAYGLIEEGLALQSLFNPGYSGVALWGGRIFGINGVYTIVNIIWIHPVWSIAIPIVFTELLFPAQRSTPYLRLPGLIITGIWYILGVVLVGLFARTSYPYQVAPILFGAVILIVFVLVVVALFVLPRQNVCTIHLCEVPTPWSLLCFAGICAFVALALPALLWRILPAIASFPLVLLSLLAPLLIAIMVVRVVYHWAGAPGWNDRHLLALASGMLIAHTVVGGLLFSTTVADGVIIGIMGLGTLIVLGLLAIYVHHRVSASEGRNAPAIDPVLRP